MIQPGEYAAGPWKEIVHEEPPKETDLLFMNYLGQVTVGSVQKDGILVRPGSRAFTSYYL